MERRIAGWASLLAGLAHGGLAPGHFAEWWGYGALFAAAAVAQVVFGLGLLLDAVDLKRPGGPAARRALLAAGAAGNALLVLLYAWTRAVGVPFFGPEAGEREAVALLDLGVVALELLAAWGALRMLRARPAASAAA